MERKRALLTGVTGQDGAYLAEFLLKKGYEVHGIKRRTSLFNTQRIDHLFHDIHEEGVGFYLHYGDLTDSTSLIRCIQQVQPGSDRQRAVREIPLEHALEEVADAGLPAGGIVVGRYDPLHQGAESLVHDQIGHVISSRTRRVVSDGLGHVQHHRPLR